jgi:putative ABC transport system permease protein
MHIGPIFRAMSHNKTRVALIVIEIAVTLAIVTNCVNMILDERGKMLRKSGFDDDNLLWVRSRPFTPEFQERQFIVNNVEADIRDIRSIPGVKSVANTGFIPWQGGGSSGVLKVAGSRDPGQRTQTYYGSGDLWGTLGVKIVEGRDFQPADFNYDPVNGSPTVAIISKAYADLMFADGKALGKQLAQIDGSDPVTIVGIIGEFYNPYGWPIHEYAVFGPATVGSYVRGTRFLVRVEPGAMKSVSAEIERRLTKSNSGRAIELKTVDEIKDTYFTGGRIVVRAMTGVIVLLIFVTALGIVGITSLSVAERTKQIGTRRALGATKSDILRHFLLENWLLTTAGLLLGVAAAYGLNLFLVTHVSGVKMDWRFVGIGMVLLWLNGLGATMLPALRGASVSPAIATRSV